MAASSRDSVLLVNKETGTRYVTSKNARNTTKKLSLKKYDKKTRTHILFGEEKSRNKAK
jgi:ribosomal protein L33